MVIVQDLFERDFTSRKNAYEVLLKVVPVRLYELSMDHARFADQHPKPNCQSKACVYDSVYAK